MKIKNLLISVLLSTVILTSCDDDDNNENSIVISTTVDASSTEEWVYFSFENNDTVSIDNPQESDAWDIAFKRLDFKTNSGTSGNGNGGVFKSDLTSLDQELEIDPSVVVDDSIQVFTMAGRTATLNIEAGSVELSGMKDADANYTEEGVWSCTVESHKHTYTANDNVFFVKCTDGEYAKVKFLSYYSLDDATSGYISFTYVK